MAENTEPIAVVGSSCRFPGGANSPSKLWELLRNPKDLLSDIPQARFNAKAFYHKNGEHHGSSNVLKSYFLDEDPKLFDHDFFNIHPKEAESMDPQQRLLLETVYEGIESAGYSMHSLRGSSTAVYIGQMTADYYDVLFRDIDSVPQYFATGTSRSIMSNRVSYFFDWKGPSITIDTACSSSLVAVHHAVQSLRNGESNLAVAGGVNLILGPELYIFESKLHMLSPTGRSRMWDSAADGYARGEGFATVVLKTLKQALADNDNIECVIRNTGVNQDGRTPGITMPSADSQAALIRSTYARAGLDAGNPEDRCQYFEAHGTGTLAGDPKEAEAIQRAFFPNPESEMEPQENSKETGKPDKLFVGSIKTIIGHLEGTAGLAGLIKASLAVQHAYIPPNMHFDNLNPAVEPFYSGLQVPTQLQRWPVVSAGTPRRASVNSFGFGGTNCHVIIENWDPDQKVHSKYLTAMESQVQTLLSSNISDPAPWGGPFLLSAQSPSALKSMVISLCKTVENAPAVDLGRLAWTLQTRRTEFQFKTSISASTREELEAKLQSIARKVTPWAAISAQTLPPNCSPRILGIFTGQGAQWPAMGAILYAESAIFRSMIDRLDASLGGLPIADRPLWSLSSELQAPPSTSRVGSAEISQPLCTAVQLALVDLLHASGIVFSAVLGHSSGEIAAVYSAGYINADDAIRIAYYRGLHSKLAGNSGKQGMMMAVGMSYSEASEFCQRAEFRSRIVPAASNGASSVTLSGDVDAIKEAEQIFNQNKTFSRLLNVDTAYHSHHMLPCAASYLESLRRCDIQVLPPQSGNCKWFSSVYGPDGRSIGDTSTFQDRYWVDNLVQPVLFTHALHRAVTEEHCHDMILEVGPHPALKGPVLETLKNLTGVDLPYTGVLSRGENDMTAFSDALGRVWSSFLHTATPMPDFRGFQKACQGQGYSREPLLLKDLPSYTWVHDKPLWKESAQSRKFRTRKYAVHELLGSLVAHGSAQEMRWRNVMKLSEIPWLDGHQFQGQVLFPAAGYISMAIEAAVLLASPDDLSPTVQLVELHDLIIHQAITLGRNDNGTEVTFVIRQLTRVDNKLTADFSCSSGEVDANPGAPAKINFTGQAIVTLGNPTLTTLPPRVPIKIPLSDVPLGRLYASLADIGLRYSGDFLVESAQRSHGLATVSLARHDDTRLIVHPSKLDAAFHGLFTAFAFPRDGRLWAPYLPTSIRRVRVSMGRCFETEYGHEKLLADCHLEHMSSKRISGNIDIFCAAHNGHHAEVQTEGLSCSSFTKATPRDDKKLFSETIWKSDVSGGLGDTVAGTLDEVELNKVVYRLVYFYLRRLRDLVSRDEIQSLEWQFQCQMEWALDYALPKIEAGGHPHINKEWVADTEDMIATWRKQYGGYIDVELTMAIGDNLPAIVRSQIPALQVMMTDNSLNRYYQDGVQFIRANRGVCQILSQLTHRYPQLNLIEIGAGTGGTTKSVVRAMADFASYTYTDISPGFFQNAQDVFRDYSGKMKYQLLNIEKDPIEQGYQPHSFDVIIAANVLHATKVLASTLRNCRRLLRPGGFLVLMEMTEDDFRCGFIVSTLSGWWLGRDDGRKWTPTISKERWNSVFLETGFSGIDTACEMASYDSHSVMVTQALDDRVSILREPLANPDLYHVQDVVVVGGATLPVAGIVRKIETLLRPFADSISTIARLEDLEAQKIPRFAAIICLSELDHPAWERMTPEKFNGMQNMILSAGQLLWVTSGRRARQPYSNMLVGMCRSIVRESPHIRMQFLDIDAAVTPATDPVLFSETLLRLIALGKPDFRDILWSLEPELAIEHGKCFIPRIVQDDKLNILADSERRTIHVEVDPATTAVEVVENSDSLVMQKFISPKKGNLNGSSVDACIQVYVSSLFPLIAVEGLPSFLSIGKDRTSGEKVLALASTNSSVLENCLSQPLFLQSDVDDGALLTEVLLTLFVESLFVATRAVLWVHEADDFLCKLLLKASVSHGKKVFLSTSKITNDSSLTFIHPYTTRRVLRSIIPTDVSDFIDMCPINSELASLCRSVFGNNIVVLPLAAVAGNGSRAIVLNYDHNQVLQILQQFVCRANENRLVFDRGTSAVSVQNFEIEKMASQHEPFGVVRWDSMQTALARVRPIDPKSLFSDQKTYLLVGLTGEIGFSLCQWMANHGARHIAITSRRPNVDPAIIEDLDRRGLNLRIFSLDISDMQGLKRVVADIRSTMPPIGGVANAAMVLRDKPFDTISLEDIQVVLGPKVDGSRNLDEIFFSDDLDFFIMFSSITTVVGNKGQCNYGMANMYMHSLAKQRRNRGVAASIIDIPLVLGIGYVARSLDFHHYEENLKWLGIRGISEVDLHSAFAAALVSGRPDSSHGPELIVGLIPSLNAPWNVNPIFSHFVRDDSQAGATRGTDQRLGSLAPTQDPKVQLASAQSSAEALSIIEMAFARKLHHILQIKEDKIDPKIPLIKLGIDSLAAVEVRAFFIKELAVDMSVLKVLSGTSLLDLCGDALASLPEELRAFKGKKAPSDQEKIVPEQGRSPPESPSASMVADTPSPSQSSSESALGEQDISITGLVTSAVTTSAEENVNSRPLYQRTGEMSFAQTRLYFLHMYLEDQSTYNVTMGGKITGVGKLDVKRFQRALRQVCLRHEGLRTSFFIEHDTGRATQAVNTEPDFIFVAKTVDGLADVEAETKQLRKYHHRIEHGQCMKVMVLSTPESQHVLFSYHHIVLDGLSWVIFLNDLDRAYSGHNFELMVSPSQAIDMSMLQRRTNTPGQMEQETEYWHKVLTPQPDTLPLFPFSKVKSRQVLRQFDSKTVEITLDAALTTQIRVARREIGVTPFHCYLASLAAFISTVLEVNDFILGITDAGRHHANYRQTVGYFLNHLPLRFRLEDSDIQFDELAQNTRDHVREALANSRLDFDALLDLLHVDRAGSQIPLFQIVLNYRVGNTAQSRLGPRSEIQWTDAIAPGNPYDLIVDVTETSELTHIAFTTQKYLYNDSDTGMIMSRYLQVLEGLMRQPKTRLVDCLSSSTADIQQAITLGRGRTQNTGWPATLSQRISEVATQYADSLAVKEGSGYAQTYGQLVSRANDIANELTSRGINAGSGAYIGVLLKPVGDAVASLLAIMQLGLIYVPLDTRNSDGRLKSILRDCQPAAVICHPDTQERARVLADAQTTLVDLSVLKCSGSARSVENYAEANRPGFAVYTSGSTGEPNGVLLLHSGVLNQVWAISERFSVGREVVLQQSSHGFDMALEQILLPLANGGTVVIAPEETRGDAVKLANLIVDENVTCTEFSPSEYVSLLRYGSEILRNSTTWRFAFSGGERVTLHLRRAFQKLGMPNLKLINVYGPTEISVSCTRGVIDYQNSEHVADEGDSFSGYVMPNYSIVILDRHQNPLPVGLPGEICIGGAGTAVGYLNRPRETSLKFIANRFATSDDISKGWNTLYRSGDMGRLLEDGSLHFLGRLAGDSQVKIHGIRVELDEIASVIAKSATAIVDAAVSWRPAIGLLVAFVVMAEDFYGDKRDFLRNLQLNLPLPSYMCPSSIIPIQQIPTNNNGKKDRIAIDNLGVPINQKSGRTDALPLTALESSLKGVWEEVIPSAFTDSRGGLNIEKSSDFFHSGGNSLLLIKLRLAIQATFGCRVSLPDLFQFSTLDRMALLVEAIMSGNSNKTSALPELDWCHEITSLMEGLPISARAMGQTRTKAQGSGLSVILTGATGFLGRYLLRSLLNSEAVREVHCIAIRPGADGELRHVASHTKVVEHAGDLSDKYLGLRATTFKQLSDRADLIIHNGADVSFLKSYASLRHTNVISTRTLLEMAIPRNIAFHFVSTASVAQFSLIEDESVLGLAERSLAAEPPSQAKHQPGTAVGYAASKWVSESLTERVVSEHSLTGCGVHRLTTAVGEDAPRTDLIHALCTYSQILKAVPRLSGGVRGTLDLLPVEDVARHIVESAFTVVEADATSLKFVHHCGEETDRVSPKDFGAYMERTFGGVYDEVSIEVWLDRARDAGLDELVYGYLKHATAGPNVIFPALQKTRRV